MLFSVHSRAASVITATVLTFVPTSVVAQDTTVVGAISGVVVNAAGQPAAGVRVGALDTASCPPWPGTGDWNKRLSYSADHRDDAYLIGFDRAGVVRWLHHGGFDTSCSDDLKARPASLARPVDR